MLIFFFKLFNKKKQTNNNTAYLFDSALKKQTQPKLHLKSRTLYLRLTQTLAPLTSVILILWSSCSANVSGAGPEQDDT